MRYILFAISAAILTFIVLSMSAPAQAGKIPNEAAWNRIAWCESKHNWKHSPTNYKPFPRWSGFYGGLQFDKGTWDHWKRYGKRSRKYSYASDAPRYIQIRVAERKRRADGLGAWPHCGKLF